VLGVLQSLFHQVLDICRYLLADPQQFHPILTQ
jgi:hypothetical protein